MASQWNCCGKIEGEGGRGLKIGKCIFDILLEYISSLLLSFCNYLCVLDANSESHQELFGVVVKKVRGKELHFDVHNEETVYSLKQKICHQEGVNVNDQRLIFEGVQLRDEVLLGVYAVKEDSVLYLAVRDQESITIFVEFLNGKVLTLHLKPSLRVDHLKSIIRDYLNIPPWKHKLKFRGQEMKDHHLLSKYEIKDCSMISFFLKPRQHEQISGMKHSICIFILPHISPVLSHVLAQVA